MVRFCIVEVGSRGLLSKSIYNALKQLGLKGNEKNRAMRDLSEDAEKELRWLWFNHSTIENKLTGLNCLNIILITFPY